MTADVAAIPNGREEHEFRGSDHVSGERGEQA
jgi:hypothetical protein